VKLSYSFGLNQEIWNDFLAPKHQNYKQIKLLFVPECEQMLFHRKVIHLNEEA